MKVVAVMEAAPTDGGGFNQALNAVLQMNRLAVGRFEFAVGSSDTRTVAALAALGIEAFHLPTTLFERLQPLLFAGPILGRLLRSMRHLFAFERRLIRAGADVVYFVTPWGPAYRLQRLCYWVTVWDVAHLDHTEFPEVRDFGQFHIRERILQRTLPSATLVVADSSQLGTRLCQRYGIDNHRMLAMPFAPAANLSGQDCAPREEVLRRFALTPGYLFYPAQFWPHKNHFRILEALALCRDRGQSLRVVFAGGDKGGRARIEAAAARMGLAPQVHFLGFVESADMRGLYEASLALVMPTYFGPTNLPPLEAWSLGVPVIYSNHLHEQAADAALLVDPDDATQLADAMLACQDADLRAMLIARGHERLKELQALRSAAEHAMLDQLERTWRRLQCSAEHAP